MAERRSCTRDVSTPQPRARRILFVDDDPAIRQALGQLIAGWGYPVDTAHDVAAALQLLAGREYGLALVDLWLPELEGLDLLARIRADRPALPVVLLSGNADLALTDRALREGAADFLYKPVSPEQLRHVIEKYLPPGS